MISTQFLQSLSSGEEEAIQTLVRAYQRPVFQLALSILDDGAGSETAAETIAEAELVTQQTFMTALDRLNRYRDDGTFEVWLFAIAIEVSRKAVRRRGTLGRLMQLLPGQRLAPNRSTHAHSRGVSAAGGLPAAGGTPEANRQAVKDPAAEEGGAETSGPGAAAAAHTGSTPPGPVHAGAAGAGGMEAGAGGIGRARAGGAGPGGTGPAGAAAIGTVAASASPADDSLWQAIRGLDLKLRLPVVLRYYHDFPVEVISRMLKLSEGAVHARLDAARERIAGKLEEKRETG